MSTFISLQIDSKATDAFAGGKFRVELERSKNSLPARGLNGRALFFQLHRNDELAILLSEQNRIIESLPTPTIEQIELYPLGAVRDQYLKYFQPQRNFDVIYSWLRYHTDDDLVAWTRLLAPLAATLITRAEAILQPDVLHLGEDSLLDKSDRAELDVGGGSETVTTAIGRSSQPGSTRPCDKPLRATLPWFCRRRSNPAHAVRKPCQRNVGTVQQRTLLPR
jgi:hypothetical protein